jgi:hypothetical protein
MGISMQASNKQNTGLQLGIGNNKPISLSGLFGNNANKGAQNEFGKQNPPAQPVQAGVNLINQTNTAMQNKNIQIHSSTNSQDIGNQQNAGKTQGS